MLLIKHPARARVDNSIVKYCVGNTQANKHPRCNSPGVVIVFKRLKQLITKDDAVILMAHTDTAISHQKLCHCRQY